MPTGVIRSKKRAEINDYSPNTSRYRVDGGVSGKFDRSSKAFRGVNLVISKNFSFESGGASP